MRNVIQLDVDHYRFTTTYNKSNEDTTYLSYRVQPKNDLVFWETFTIDFVFHNDSLTSFIAKPSSNYLVYTGSRLDRFNEVLGILTRYYAWTNDSQVNDMAALMGQVGSEYSLLQVNGNLSLRIQMYSDIAEYRFSNYFNGVEYNGVRISKSESGDVYFSDNRASQKIGNTTIGITEEQARKIAEEYVAVNPFRGTTQNSHEVTNLNTSGVKAVYLKSTEKLNNTLYPYYEVQFNVEADSVLDGYGVNVGANDGEVWSAYSYSSSTGTNSISQMPFFFFTVLPVAVVAVVVVVIVLLLSRRNRSRTELPVAA